MDHEGKPLTLFDWSYALTFLTSSYLFESTSIQIRQRDHSLLHTHHSSTNTLYIEPCNPYLMFVGVLDVQLFDETWTAAQYHSPNCCCPFRCGPESLCKWIFHQQLIQVLHKWTSCTHVLSSMRLLCQLQHEQHELNITVHLLLHPLEKSVQSRRLGQ
jgi:hypothetical protein